MAQHRDKRPGGGKTASVDQALQKRIDAVWAGTMQEATLPGMTIGRSDGPAEGGVEWRQGLPASTIQGATVDDGGHYGPFAEDRDDAVLAECRSNVFVLSAHSQDAPPIG